jgi:hypothetical protein
MSDSSATQTYKKPELPPFPDADIEKYNSTNQKKKVLNTLIEYIDKVRTYLLDLERSILLIDTIDAAKKEKKVREAEEVEKERLAKEKRAEGAVVGQKDESRGEFRGVFEPLPRNNNNNTNSTAPVPTNNTTTATTSPAPPAGGDGAQAGGKKKQRKTKKKGGADIDYSKVYNVQGLIENISKSTGKDPITSQSIPAPFSTGSPLQRLGKKEAKSLPNELKNEIIPDYSQDGGKKKKTDKKKMPKKK